MPDDLPDLLLREIRAFFLEQDTNGSAWGFAKYFAESLANRLAELARRRERDARIESRQIASREAEGRIAQALAGLEAAALSEATLTEAFNHVGLFVYCLWGDDDDKPVYVGQTANLLARLGDHAKDKDFRRVTLIRCESERQMIATEARLILHYQPPLNTAGKAIRFRGMRIPRRA